MQSSTQTRTRAAAVVAATLALALGAVACGGDSDDDDERGGTRTAQVIPPRGLTPQRELGKGEGRLDLVAWPGYVEDGSTDPQVDWVTPFEKRTGCNVEVRYAETSGQMVTLMRSGTYDGLSASGDATLRLVAGGDVVPVNTDLVPSYADVFDGLKDLPHNSVDGQMYGIPIGRGANILMWNEEEVDPPPDSWSVVFDPDSPHKGRVTAYDSPIYIADAALYLKATRPELKIDNVYELDTRQFEAAVDLLEQQSRIVGRYWSDYQQEQRAFNRGDVVVGTTWQAIANVVADDRRVRVRTTLPKEGATGWSDTWMVSARAEHPNCMYLWMEHVTSPKVNAQVAEWFGEAPANRKACAETIAKDHCDTFHAEDEAYYDRVSYWTTPTANCGDDRGPACKDYAAWTNAWAALRREARGVAGEADGR